MITIQEIGKWEPLNKMEDASEDLILKRLIAVKDVKLPHYPIKTIPFIGFKSKVTYTSNELISLCPVTFLPDLNTITITYEPDQSAPELKALKFYLTDYILLPISHEMLASKVLNDFCLSVKPTICNVKLTVAIRGGIKTIVEVGDEVKNS